MTEDKVKYEVKTKQLERHRNLMNQLGDLIAPRTQGFEHVNLDMTFTDLDKTDSLRVENLAKMIDICHIKGYRQSEYIARGELATLLNSRRSKEARTMRLFGEVNTNQKQTFKDETDEGRGFRLMKGRKGAGVQQ